MSKESPPTLDYTQPPTSRRSARLAGLLGHLFASYLVGFSGAAWLGVPPKLEVAIFLAVAPLWMPAGFLLPGTLRGQGWLWLCAYAAVLYVAYRWLRKPGRV